MGCFAIGLVGAVFGVLLVNWVAPLWYRARIRELEAAVERGKVGDRIQ